MDDKLKNDILLKRLDHLLLDTRFVKTQQWRITYYSLILIAAIYGSVRYYDTPRLGEKIIAIAALLLVGHISAQFQRKCFIGILRYRRMTEGTIALLDMDKKAEQTSCDRQHIVGIRGMDITSMLISTCYLSAAVSTWGITRSVPSEYRIICIPLYAAYIGIYLIKMLKLREKVQRMCGKKINRVVSILTKKRFARKQKPTELKPIASETTK